MKLRHIANPLVETELPAAVIAGGTCIESGYVRTTNADNSKFGIKWMQAGEVGNPAHVFELQGLSPSDIDFLARNSAIESLL